MSFAFAEGLSFGDMRSSFAHRPSTRLSSAFCSFGVSARYAGESLTSWVVRRHRDAGVTTTVNRVESEPTLPAASVAVADRVCSPGASVHAASWVLVQVVEASPD